MTYESITVAGTAVPLTAATYGDCPNALCTVETAAIRWTVDGTTPVAGGPGHLAQAGEAIELHTIAEVRGFRAIRESGVSAALRCSYGSGMFTGGR